MGIGSRLREIVAEQVRPDILLGAGSEAPSFDLEAADGVRVHSGELLGSSQVVLLFYPLDGPAAGERLRPFEALRERFEGQRCRLFGIGGGGRPGGRLVAQVARLAEALHAGGRDGRLEGAHRGQ